MSTLSKSHQDGKVVVEFFKAMKRAINSGSEAQMYQERRDGFYSTGLASGTSLRLYSLKPVSKVRTDPFSKRLQMKLCVFVIALCGGFYSVAGQDYEAVGTLESRSYLGTNIFAEYIYDFHFSVSDCQWFLHAKIRESQMGGILQTNNFDYIEAGFDGRQIYSVTSLETFAKNHPNSQAKNVAVGDLIEGNVPVDLDPFINDLWLGFGSSCYFASLTNSWLYPVYLTREAAKTVNGRFAVKGYWNLLPGEKSLPSSVVFTFEFEGKASKPNYETWMKHTNAMFAVEQYTNVDGFVTPTEFMVNLYNQDGSLLRESRVSASVSKKSSREASFIPKLPGKTPISDQRLANSSKPDLTVDYLATNWPAIEQAQKVYSKQSRAEAEIAALNPQKQDNTSKFRLVVICGLVLSTLVFLVLLKRNIKYQNKKGNI
jgi:hypothetical protein